MTARDDSLTALEQADSFVGRHIGPRDEDVAAMLETVGYASLDALMDAAVPASIRARIPEDFPESRTERDVLAALAELAGRNRVARTMIGLGYHDTLTPRSSSATSWRIRAGTPPTRPISRRFRKGGWKRCSTSRPW